MAASLVVIGAAVVLLREPEAAEDGPRPAPPPQTTVAAYTSDGVVLPEPQGAPVQPERIEVEPGPQRLRLWWPPVEDAVGYEVRWGERTRLVAQPAVQLDGLTDGMPYAVEVRSVGEHGERSLAAKTQGMPQPDDQTGWAFADDFDAGGPHPGRWRFTSVAGCGSAGPGSGDDARRLVVAAQCGSEPVSLAARTPLRLAEGPGELGRFVVDTDQPGMAGELVFDLVPGQVDQVGPASAPPGGPGKAQEDAALPPGAVRVRIAAEAGQTAVDVLVGRGTPRRGVPTRISNVPRPEIGVTARWEVVLHTDGVRVLRDGLVVGAGDAVPAWREATAIVSLVGDRTGVRAAVDFIAFRGAPTVTPPLVPSPQLDPGQVVSTGGSPQTPSGGARVDGVSGGRLLLTLVPQNGPDDPKDDAFAVEVGGKQYPAKPAVPGQPLLRGVRYPVVADLPTDALILRADGRTLPLRVHGPAHPGRAATRVVAAHLELTPRPGAVPPAPTLRIDPQDRTRPALARPSAVLLNAAGTPLESGGLAPRGRLVVEVALDAVGGQQIGGELAGLAGVEVRLDRTRLAGIPTVVDGPGIGGTWRIAIDTTALPPGRHSIEVRAVGVDARAAFAVAYTPFELA
ncbi:fibronectin type III domain-containing protein [Actinokineospora sp. NPDC004072]